MIEATDIEAELQRFLPAHESSSARALAAILADIANKRIDAAEASASLNRESDLTRTLAVLAEHPIFQQLHRPSQKAAAADETLVLSEESSNISSPTPINVQGNVGTVQQVQVESGGAIGSMVGSISVFLQMSTISQELRLGPITG